MERPIVRIIEDQKEEIKPSSNISETEKEIERIEKDIRKSSGGRTKDLKDSLRGYRERLKRDKAKLRDLSESARSLEANSKKKLVNEDYDETYTRSTPVDRNEPTMRHIGDAYSDEIKTQTTKAYDVAREAELVAVGRLKKSPEEMKGLRDEISDEIENIAKNLAILHPTDYGKIVALCGIAKVLVRAKRKLDDSIHEAAMTQMSGMVESLKARGLTESETYKKSVTILEKWKG